MLPNQGGTQEVIQDIPAEQRHPSGNSRNSLPRRSRNSRDMERPTLRHGGPAGGDWQSDPHMEWKRHILVQPLPGSILQRAIEGITEMSRREVEEYQKQLRQRPHMICTSGAGSGANAATGAKKDNERNKKAKYQTRAQRPMTIVFKSSEDSSDESSNHEEGLSDSSPSSSGYSDWMADEGMNLEPPKRSKRRQVLISDDDEDDDEDDEVDIEEEEDEDDVDLSSDSDCRRPSTSGNAGTSSTAAVAGPSSLEARKKLKKRKKLNKNAANSTAGSSTASTSGLTNKKIKVTEKYKLSEWLSETKPRKSPYFPQMGDEVVYFIQGHQLYLEAVKAKNVYEISGKDLPWNKMQIKDREYAKVIGIQYEIKPPRLCCLKLAMMDESGRLTGKIFTVKYHDMPDVLDFFVLKQTYITSVSRNWGIDDKFRCMIDDEWWIGRVLENSPASDQFPDSPFMCYAIKWLNGETERMSPWDMEPLDTSSNGSTADNERTQIEDESQALPVLESELNAILYKPMPGDWPNNDRDAVTRQILLGLTKVMELAIAEPFLVPVDINLYPTYAFIIEYPMDLSTIKARFENNFYRRLTAAQFDIRYLATNAEKFNERHSVIVKHARILTELCLRIVKSGANFVDVPAIYHQLVDSYASTDSDEEAAGGVVGDLVMPSGSSSRSKMAMRILPSRVLKSPNDWQTEAQQLMDALWNCEDSLPFRAPVNTHKYPDYLKVIKEPMDLGTVRNNLDEGRYETPQAFSKDVRLIFRNSRMYNTNKRSRIYVMTVRLAAIFEEHIIKIVHNWKVAKRRQQHHNHRHRHHRNHQNVETTTKRKQLKTNRNHRINSSGDSSSSKNEDSCNETVAEVATIDVSTIDDGNSLHESATDPLIIADNDSQMCDRIEIVEEGSAGPSSTQINNHYLHHDNNDDEDDDDDDDLTLNIIKNKHLNNNSSSSNSRLLENKRKSTSSSKSMNDDDEEDSEDSYKPEEDDEEEEDEDRKAHSNDSASTNSLHRNKKKKTRRKRVIKQKSNRHNDSDVEEDLSDLEEEEDDDESNSSQDETKTKPKRQLIISSSEDEEDKGHSSNKNNNSSSSASSSSNSNSSTELIKYQRRKSKRRKPLIKQIDYNEEDDDSDDDLPLERHRKRRRIENDEINNEFNVVNSTVDGTGNRELLSNETDQNRSTNSGPNNSRSSNSSSCFTTTVSSRGRVRKLTPRAQALMKAPHKFV